MFQTDDDDSSNHFSTTTTSSLSTLRSTYGYTQNSDDLAYSPEHPLHMIDALGFDDESDDQLLSQELTHRKREAFLREFFEAERGHLETLCVIRRDWLEPLKNSKAHHFLGIKSKALCKDEELRWIFGDLEGISNVQREIVTGLKERLSIWGPTQIISDVLQQSLTALSVAYTKYLQRYDQGLITYERLLRISPHFKKTLERMRRDRGHVLPSLLHLLIGAVDRHVQRITRLADLTTPMHPDGLNLARCKEYAISVSANIRPLVLDLLNMEDVCKVHRLLPFPMRTKRRLVLRLDNDLRDEIYILFTDFLAILSRQANHRLMYKGHLDLVRAHLVVQDTTHVIKIVPFALPGLDLLESSAASAPNPLTLTFTSTEHFNRWRTALQSVINA